MKKKPDLSTFIPPQKDPSEFLDKGAADIADRSHIAPQRFEPSIKPEPVVQKLFRLRWDTANALRLAAAQESVREGRRVTETEIIESLLRRQLEIDS